MSAYPTLNGVQCRGPGGDGRLLAATMQRAGWASFLTRNGERVDHRAITDIHQLAKDLAHASPTPAPAESLGTGDGHRYNPELAAAITETGRAAITQLITTAGLREIVEHVRPPSPATLAAEAQLDRNIARLRAQRKGAGKGGHA